MKSAFRVLVISCLCFTISGCSGGAGSGSGSADFASSSAVPSVPSGPISDFKLSCQEARFVVLLNLYRASQGKGSVAVSRAGTVAARWHAQDMITQDYFSHTEPSGRSPFARMNSFGYPGHAENIAAGTTSADRVFCMWRNSPGHNTNMLRDSRTVGIGLVEGYWSNGFGPMTEDTLTNPLTRESGCALPSEIPSC